MPVLFSNGLAAEHAGVDFGRLDCFQLVNRNVFVQRYDQRPEIRGSQLGDLCGQRRREQSRAGRHQFVRTADPPRERRILKQDQPATALVEPPQIVSENHSYGQQRQSGRRQ
ncbi:hypothetical protein [Dactylosporangium sp. NPDC049140]|uniref:hypothetical protein n=1 Tax=Dactylosporangium sp. NPDC049140 TaxID=3155647 RepID=UPI0033D2FFAE